MPELPILAQRDYGGTRLGYCDGVDRGENGCRITSDVMLARHYEVELTVPEYDEMAALNGWYVDGCLATSDMVVKAAAKKGIKDLRLEASWDFWGGPADPRVIVDELDADYVIGIDARNAGGGPSHYVRFWGWSGDRLMVADPWLGQVIDLQAVYGGGWDLPRLIGQVDKYRRPGFVPAWAAQTAATAPAPPQSSIAPSEPAAAPGEAPAPASEASPPEPAPAVDPPIGAAAPKPLPEDFGVVVLSGPPAPPEHGITPREKELALARVMVAALIRFLIFLIGR